MTTRDRTLIALVLVAVAVLGFWFVGLAPKRKEAADIRSQVEAASQQLAQAQQTAGQARKAKANYNKDYAQVASLGKAVPKGEALPSLLYQLQSAARGARIDFTSLKVTSSSAAGASAGPPATTTAPAAKGADASAPSTSTPAPAASAPLPPGVIVGSAGLPTMPFSFVFDGSFFAMESFLREVQRFVRVHDDRVDVRGRLLSVEGFSLIAAPSGFPAVKASISATAYLMAPGGDAAGTPDAGAAAPDPTTSGDSTASTPPAGTASQVAQ